MAADTANGESIIMYTTSWCPDCHRAKHLLNEYGIPYVEIDVEEDANALTLVKQVNRGRRVVPTIIFPDGSILVEPPTLTLAEKLGLKL